MKPDTINDVAFLTLIGEGTSLVESKDLLERSLAKFRHTHLF